ncbi:MAG: 6-carboxytetrahydropterin synthase [Pseudomonadota bacterium]|nr:6-carboxytetrahydropterin synthase [Pseudomonadota bacterium]
MHEHSFAVRISVAGDVHNDTGWVMDFSDVSAAFKPLLKRPDPHYLNEVDDLGN